MLPNDGHISVDSKKDCSELYSNLITDHDRFHRECVLARECGIQLIILVENKDGIKQPEDIIRWHNPQYFRYWIAKKKAERLGIKSPKPPASNVQLLKVMKSMTRDYGVRFEFVRPEDSAPRIIELLGGSK